ncbi:hypothetical protein OUZ56_017180 [Daphnia magna]|uniref:Uncharacterized protein n=1 Tax=Daphnia magna TaxID=35525 RepID=A0ABR0ASC1_9CRUS|nr:hypothetical protein OUZ56_017180 [Daphnia magna]
MPPKSAPVALQQIITNSEAESVLTSSGYYKCLRNRKRTLDQLKPQYASRLRYKAAKILEGWCQDGVPSNDIWGYLQNSTDLISKFSLKPLPLNHPAIESEVLHHELLLRHWAAFTSQKQSDMTYLLTLLKLYEPNPTYALLPSTGKELMKIDGNDWPTSRNKQLKNKLPPAIPIDSGKYVHFGVENAINGISVGLINRATDLVKFFDVYQKNSNLLSKSMRARIEALDTTFQIEQAKLVLRGDFTTREAEINVPHYEMDINIDEAKLNEDKQAATITPILGKLVSIKSSASSDDGTKILLDTSVFVIGFYVGVGKPADINSFLSNLIIENAKCQKWSQEVLLFQTQKITKENLSNPITVCLIPC